MDSTQFQKRALESFTRLENGLVEVKEGHVKLEEGQRELKKDIQFLHDDMNSKFEMLANAIKELVERMATREEYDKRFKDLESRIRELEQK
jgi:hypothetical protein